MKKKSKLMWNSPLNNDMFTAEKSKAAKDSKYEIKWLLDIGFFYGTLTKGKAIQIARVSERQFNMWERGTAKAHPAILELLRLHAFGEPPSGMDKAWNGWIFRNGKLINYDWNYVFSAQDLRAVVWWQPFANKLACENLSLKNRVADLMFQLAEFERVKIPVLTLVVNK